MTKQQGRKALVILCDGVDTGSQETLAAAVEAAQRADTLVYSILFADEQAYGNRGGFGGYGRSGMGGKGRQGGGPGRYPQEVRPDGKKILERISKQTGAVFLKFPRSSRSTRYTTRASRNCGIRYSLGYTPDRRETGPGYHTIRLITKQKDQSCRQETGITPSARPAPRPEPAAGHPGGFEANPLQKPFVHSRLLYVTSQPDAFLADYLMLRQGRTTKVQIACDALGWSITGAHLGSGLHNTKLNDQLDAFYARLKATNVVHATAPAKP